jgi:hypothetical protein
VLQAFGVACTGVLSRRPWPVRPWWREVLSYAGTLTLTATVDPGHFRDLSALTDALRAELDLIIRSR